MNRLTAVVLGCAALAGVVTSTASAVIPGPNGKLVFTSGRAGGDGTAQLYTIGFPSGSAVQFTSAAASRHSHPNWSPDRTRIAYTVGPAASDKHIAIRNVISGVVTDFTTNDAINEDNPSWSPDGTRIAYTSEVSDGSGQSDILIKNVSGGGTPLNLTGTGGELEVKPIWTPDSATIIYARNSAPNGEKGIYSEPSDNSVLVNPPTVVNEAGVDDWQPALSPDGSKLCYTRGPMSSQTDVYTVRYRGRASPANFSNAAGAGNSNGGINCVWSPDGTRIAYTRGVFDGGRLGYRNADKSNSFQLLSDVAGDFDGNADWAPDPRRSASTAR